MTPMTIHHALPRELIPCGTDSPDVNSAMLEIGAARAVLGAAMEVRAPRKSGLVRTMSVSMPLQWVQKYASELRR